MNEEQIKIIGEDLEYLRDGWGPNIPDPDIRRGSAVLRRLLVESSYSQAWRSAGFEKQPKVIAVDLENMFGKHNFDLVILSIALGANFRGLFFGSISIHKTPLVNEPPFTDFRENGYPYEREFYLTEYMDSLSGIADGIYITRRETIKYMANVKGGVHLSSKQRVEEMNLIEKMTEFEKRATIHTSDGLMVEIVSIAQAIGMSDDAQKLIEFATKL